MILKFLEQLFLLTFFGSALIGFISWIYYEKCLKEYLSSNVDVKNS